MFSKLHTMMAKLFKVSEYQVSEPQQFDRITVRARLRSYYSAKGMTFESAALHGIALSPTTGEKNVDRQIIPARIPLRCVFAD